jgi:hypothetical protein
MKYFFYFILFIANCNLFAQWTNDPYNNLFISNWGDSTPIVINDDSTGIYLGYGYTPFNDTIPSEFPYVIKLTGEGNYGWEDALYVGSGEDTGAGLNIIPDGFGGFYVSYVAQKYKYREHTAYFWDYQIRVNRFDKDGNRLWGDGVWITADSLNDEYQFKMIANGQKGCFFSWKEELEFHDVSDSGKRKIQYISIDGERLWGEEGITILDGDINQTAPVFRIYNYDSDKLLIVKTEDFEAYQLAIFDEQGLLEWELPLRAGKKSHSLVTKNSSIFLFFKIGLDDPLLAKMDYDLIENNTYTLPETKTLYDSVSVSFKIYNNFYTDTLISFYWKLNTFFDEQSESYFQQININGEKVHDNFGIAPYYTPYYSVSYRYPISMTKSDSALYFIYSDDRSGQGSRYTQKLNFKGDFLWNQDILYTANSTGGTDQIILNRDDLVIIWKNAPAGYWGQKVNSDGSLGNITAIMVNLNIYDIKGSLIWSYSNFFKPGQNTIRWKGKSNSNQTIASGMYFYELIINDNAETKKSKKLLLIK